LPLRARPRSSARWSLWGAEFLGVALAKLWEAFRPVREPPPQLVARRQIARPLVYLRLLLGDSARPETVNENAVAVIGRGRLVARYVANTHHGIMLFHTVAALTLPTPILVATGGAGR
jgi:hypothetical protein